MMNGKKYDMTRNEKHDVMTCPVCGGKLEYVAGHNYQVCVTQPWECTKCHASGRSLDADEDRPSFLRHIEVRLEDGTPFEC